jgi:antitoxin PrlF
MSTTVTAKGQVTIPKPVRDLLGIKTGTRVDFELKADGQVVLVNPEAPERPRRFARLRGRAGPGLSTDEILALTRGED